MFAANVVEHESVLIDAAHRFVVYLQVFDSIDEQLEAGRVLVAGLPQV